ncbi:unnamed protein product [Acanthoscelides obtectus]|uniref:Uncharacterized protein n=1 Tax=Acanthoscelides obtectus TaxID=200917 RepID=A0A9P0MB20_ACAOB|nr:unnamed protein product [Acanthoscelides obtectus]CAK1661733.1 hypothetical protein AOBTE_LOCUS22762 [Acanthoscelides obtectus]
MQAKPWLDSGESLRVSRIIKVEINWIEYDLAIALSPKRKRRNAGTSKEIQNDLLDCILEVCHEEIIKQINRASYLAIIADETTFQGKPNW